MIPGPRQPALFGGGSAPAARRVVPRARALKTASGLLYGVLAGVCAGLRVGALGDEVFRDLVIARAVEPTSDTKTLTAQANRARKVITGGKPARTAWFVKTARGWVRAR